MAVTLRGLFTVSDRVITDQTSTLGSVTLTALQGAYDDVVATFMNGSGSVVAVDVYRAMTITPQLNSALTLSAFIGTYLNSDLALMQAPLNSFPRLDPVTKKFDNRLVTFDPIRQDGVSVTYGRIEAPANTGPQYRGISKDLLFTVDGTILTANPNNWLVSVNGVLHKTIVDQTTTGWTVWVVDGFENVKQFQKLNLMVLDTTMLGGHTIVPITKSNIVTTGASLFNGAALQFPAGTFTNTTALLCMDGYLNILDRTYQIVSDHAMKVNTSTIEWKSQFINNPNQRFSTDIFGVKNRINPYTGINQTLDTTTTPDANDTYLDTFTKGPTMSPSVFQDPSFLLSRLTSNHSFIVLINNPNIYTRSWSPISYGDDGKIYELISQETPRGAMFYNTGKIISYVMRSSKNQRHTFHIDPVDISTDEYLTVLNPDLIASRKASILDTTTPRPVKVVDLYTGPLP